MKKKTHGNCFIPWAIAMIDLKIIIAICIHHCTCTVTGPHDSNIKTHGMKRVHVGVHKRVSILSARHDSLSFSQKKSFSPGPPSFSENHNRRRDLNFHEIGCGRACATDPPRACGDCAAAATRAPKVP